MEYGKVSIIVPVYNAAAFLPRCIESICNQSYRNLELILIDDGSTDRSLEICRFFSDRIKNIKVITQLNSGVSLARNAGILTITGDFVTFVDSDDWLDTRAIEIALDSLQKYQADVVTYGWRRIFENGNDTESCTEPFEVIKDSQAIIRRILENYSALGGGYPWNKLWRKDTLSTIELFDPELFYFEDLEWVIRMMRHVHKMVVCPVPLYNYYVRSSSVTNQMSIREKNELGYHHAIAKIEYTLQKIEGISNWFKEKYYPEIVNGIIHARRNHWADVEQYLFSRLCNVRIDIIQSKKVSLRTKLRCVILIAESWRR